MINKSLLGSIRGRRPSRPARLADRPIAGTIAVVTGAGSGIGRATSIELARRDARVVAVDIDADAAGKVAVECAEVGPDAVALGCDVADGGAVADLARRVEADVGPVAVLVNNAGVGMTARLTDMTLDDWVWIRSINLDGVVHGCHAFAPAMRRRRAGQIVNVSSGLAYTPRSMEPAYVTTKAAVLALSRSLRADLASDNVGVTALCPGVIDTAILDATRFIGAATDEARARRLFAHGHPPETVASAVVHAVRTDPAVLPVGWEARLGWAVHHLAPTAFQQFIARRDI